MSDAIEFDFVVVKVETMADGAPRVKLDLPESALPEAFMLADAKQRGLYLHAVVTENDDFGKIGE